MERVGELLAALCHEDDRAYMLRVEEQLHRFTSAQLAEESEDVIVFPPFTGHHRFLLHLVAERFQLHSNSSGYGQDRTTTVSVGNNPPCIPDLSLADLIPAHCAWKHAGWVQGSKPMTEAAACLRGSEASHAPPPAQKQTPRGIQERAAAVAFSSQHAPSTAPTTEARTASRSGDSKSRPLSQSKSCGSSQRKRQTPMGVYQPPQRRGAGQSPVSTPPPGELRDADAAATPTSARVVHGGGDARFPCPSLQAAEPPELDARPDLGASPPRAPDTSHLNGTSPGIESAEGVSTQVPPSVVRVDLGPWEAERQRALAEEREGLHGRLARYVECSGRAQAVWHRSWRLHEPNNGVVQFSVPASALEKNAVVRVALSAQAPAAGGRGGQGARAGARGAAYEVVLDWESDECTVRRTKPGAWNEPVQELWAKTSALSKLALHEADNACVTGTNSTDGRSLFSIQAGCTQAWWVAVRENLLVLGSGSVVGAGITVAAQDADTPLPVQMVGFHCHEKHGRGRLGRSDVTLKSINVTWPLASCAAHLGHILLLTNWQSCMNQDRSMDCKSLQGSNTQMHCNLSRVKEWVGMKASICMPADATCSVENRLQEATCESHLSPNVKIADSKWAWIICASLSHAQKVLIGVTHGYDADCSMQNPRESGGAVEVTCVDTPKAYPACQWVGVCPPEILLRAGFIAAKARPATSATVASRLISNAITR